MLKNPLIWEFFQKNPYRATMVLINLNLILVTYKKTIYPSIEHLISK